MTPTVARIWSLMAGILPVFAFLLALKLLDTFRLLRPGRIAVAVGWGMAAGLASLGLNAWLFDATGPQWYAKFGAPWVEEGLKAIWLVVLIRRERVAFLVDAAICGFAIGAGFALVENLAYLEQLLGGGIALWVLRGFGTAVMHGGAAAIVGVVAIGLRRSGGWFALVAGLAVAIGVHTLWDVGILTPLQASLTMVLGLPPVFVLIFESSEKALHRWMGQKLNQDMELLEMLTNGNFLETPAGRYLRSLNAFAPQVLGDMVCILQISSELSAAAKGERIRQWAGLPTGPDPDLEAKLRELEFLEKSVGLAGRHALAPILPLSSRDRWELQELQARG